MERAGEMEKEQGRTEKERGSSKKENVIRWECTSPPQAFPNCTWQSTTKQHTCKGSTTTANSDRVLGEMAQLR